MRYTPNPKPFTRKRSLESSSLLLKQAFLNTFARTLFLMFLCEECNEWATGEARLSGPVGWRCCACEARKGRRRRRIPYEPPMLPEFRVTYAAPDGRPSMTTTAVDDRRAGCAENVRPAAENACPTRPPAPTCPAARGPFDTCRSFRMMYGHACVEPFITPMIMMLEEARNIVCPPAWTLHLSGSGCPGLVVTPTAASRVESMMLPLPEIQDDVDWL